MTRSPAETSVLGISVEIYHSFWMEAAGSARAALMDW
jgi:hypothetical protein